ncbi:sugar phosphate isomerase/epimerase [soil metagenome]
MTTSEPTKRELLATCWTTAGDAVPLPGRDDSPIPLKERIEQAGKAGFSGFGVVHNDLERYLADSSLDELARIFAANGITSIELEFLTDWWKPDEERQESDRLFRFLLEATEVLHPHHVKVGPDITGGVHDLALWAERWYGLSDAFAAVGTVIALEFMPFSNIRTLDEAIELVTTANHPAGGLMVDFWHIMRGGPDELHRLEDVPLEWIKGVELNDGDIEQIDDGYSDTVLRRRIPGQGAWPVPQFIRTLEDKGWTGPWGVEILSETYRVRSLDEVLPEVVAATRHQFELAETADAR